MKLYTFTFEAGEDYSATFTISGTYSLYNLAEYMIQTLDFDFDHAFGFYDNLKNPYRSKEKYTLFADMGEPEDDEPGVEKTLIEDVFYTRKRLCFLFDYGDDWWMPIRCDAVKTTEAKRKSRRLLSEKGTKPTQYPDPDWDDEDDDEEWDD